MAVLPIDGYFECYVNHCGGRLVQRSGKHGPFFGCSNYPRCTATRSQESVNGEYACKELGVQGDPDEPRLE